VSGVPPVGLYGLGPAGTAEPGVLALRGDNPSRKIDLQTDDEQPHYAGG
jgi:hypothetical protein